MTAMTRFLSKTRPANNGKGCIFWVAGKRRAGYGQFFWNDPSSRRSVMMSAHTWIYEQTHGPVPVGTTVMHTCDEPACVNVEHLKIGTQLDNLADMRSKGRQVKGGRVGGARLTAEQVIEIRALYQRGERMWALAEKYGVSRITIHDAIRRVTWRHVA